jgi:predicted aspartyl protease
MAVKRHGKTKFIVNIRIEGRLVRAKIDTGAETTAIDEITAP